MDRITRNLNMVQLELGRIDGPDDCRDTLLQRLASLKALVEVQIPLQSTANLLRLEPSLKTLPNQQATRVKHVIQYAFRKDGGSKEKRLREFDCDALKLCGLAYTVADLAKMDNMKFEIMQTAVRGFIDRLRLRRHLYRADIEKAVNATLKAPDDDDSYLRFLNGTDHPMSPGTS